MPPMTALASVPGVAELLGDEVLATEGPHVSVTRTVAREGARRPTVRFVLALIFSGLAGVLAGVDIIGLGLRVRPGRPRDPRRDGCPRRGTRLGDHQAAVLGSRVA
jgi:hypothetical protein